MNTSDAIGYSLVALVGALGCYACYLFETRVKEGLAQEILDWFI